MNKNIFISLVNWSNWQDTLNVIQQLIGFEFSGFKISIGVVDNASPNDSFYQLKKQLPETVHLTQANSNEGYAAGHVVNLKRAKEEDTDYFWVLNSDIELFEQTLRELVKVSEQFNNQALVGSVTLSDPNTIDFGGSEWMANDTELHYNDWKGKSINELLNRYPESYRVQSLEGSSMLIPMQIIEQYGFMKTDFFMYGEETDYCLRLDKKGIPSYIATNSQLIHENEGSLNENADSEYLKAYYRRRNYLRITREHFSAGFVEVIQSGDGLVNNLKALVKGILKKKGVSYHYALGTVHAAVGIKGKRI